MMSKKDLTDLKKLARNQGWEVTTTPGGHLRWQPPCGEFISTSATPSDSNIIKTIKSELCKAGLILDRAKARRFAKARRKQTNPTHKENSNHG